MARLGGALDVAQRLGNRIDAYRNIAWLVGVLTATVVFVVMRFGAGWAAFALLGCMLSTSVGMLLLAAMLFRRATTPAYSWVSAEYIYRFAAEDLKRQTQTIKIKIRANRDNVNLFQNSYRWTGAGSNEIKVVGDPTRRVCRTQQRISKRQYYYVHLDTPLNKGDETLIHLEQKLYDRQAEFQPLLAMKVSEPLDALTLKVVIPSYARPGVVVARQTGPVGPGQEQWRPVKTGRADQSDDGMMFEASYSPAGPRVGRRYELNWEFWKNYPQADTLG